MSLPGFYAPISQPLAFLGFLPIGKNKAGARGPGCFEFSIGDRLCELIG
jgi:hypothetical protein